MIFKCDDCMGTIFIPLHKAVSNLLSQFYDYVFDNAYSIAFLCIYLYFSVCVCLIGE